MRFMDRPLVDRPLSFLRTLLLLVVALTAACSNRRTATLTAGDMSVRLSENGAVLAISKGEAIRETAAPGPAGTLTIGNRSYPLLKAIQSAPVEGGRRWTYAVPEAALRMEIIARLEAGPEAVVFSREINLRSDRPLDQDLTVKISLIPLTLSAETWLPLKNGAGVPLGAAEEAAYQFAGVHPSNALVLAIPMVSAPGGPLTERCTVATDPYFTTRFMKDAVAWTYPRAVGLEHNPEKRSVALIFHPGDAEAALSRFFETALKGIPPGPDWLHDIAMVDYDFMASGGRGWFEDIDALTAALPEADRSQVLLCNHGWYDYVGRYSYNTATGKLDPEWTAFANAPRAKNTAPSAVPVAMSLQKMHDRMAYAKTRGFRVGLYFGDGMNAGDGLPDIYRPDRVLFWGGWEGPDTIGKTYCQNPLHPDVRKFFLGYLEALLEEFGPDIDALVWDETFHVDSGSLGSKVLPGYADRAMMTLVRDLTLRVDEYNRRTGRQVAFMASDCIGILGWLDKAPYALVSDGTYQDSRCLPEGWSYGIFPNYRNVLWSCNWDPVKHFDYTEFGVRNYQAPVAISNGGETDQGFARMSPAMKLKILDLFRWRKQFRTRLHWFEKLPVFDAGKK